MNHLGKLSLSRLGEASEAGLLITSLPWPRATPAELTLDARPTYVRQLGRWPSDVVAGAGQPRRLLMIADAGSAADPAGTAPATLKLGSGCGSCSGPSQPPAADALRFEASEESTNIWERHLLRIRHGSRQVGFAMGLRTKQGVHWWEACRLVEIESTPTCRTVEMGGAIPYEQYGFEVVSKYPGLTNPYLHKHNWVNGHIMARLHSNGVCEIFAHHINAKYVDPGRAFENAVPVIGLWFGGELPEVQTLGAWDGSRNQLEHAGVKFDLTEVARLATTEKPGCWDTHKDFLVLQPYQGMELYGGTCPRQLTGQPWIYRSEEQTIPQGMARTLRFSVSLSDRSPRVARYLAPAWWYGLCEEFTPRPLLPVSNKYDYRFKQAQRWVTGEAVVQGGFEDGCAARSTGDNSRDAESGRFEPGWEGELPYGTFLAAWRTSDTASYETAMRMSYHFADVVVDHALNLARMHGYPPPAISLPMQRALGMLAAFLETGDDYLYETSEAMIDNAFRLHRNSWPRLAVGRDACFIRGAVMLYRYFGDQHFRRIAQMGAMDVVHAQQDDGGYGDQGGGTGIHQRSSYVVKPWMCMLATSALLDYLDYVEENPAVAQAVLKMGDWLLRERHAGPEGGARGWSYQHFYGKQRKHWNAVRNGWMELPGPPSWHQESLGRTLLRCTRMTGDASYIDAWAESFDAKLDRETRGDHNISSTLQHLMTVQDQLWEAQVGPGQLQLKPTWFGPRTPLVATLSAPQGPVQVSWRDDRGVDAPAGSQVEPTVLAAPESTQPAAVS